MKAIEITGQSQLEYKDVPIPSIRNDEILVRIKAVGVCKTDFEVLEGKHPYTKKIFSENVNGFHLIPGHEWSGIVQKIGKNCRNFTIGDHVIGETTINCGHCEYCKRGRPNLCENVQEIGITRDGAMAEFLSIPCKFLHKIPESMSFKKASCIEPTAVAVHAISRLLHEIPPRKIGDLTVAIFGDGPIALLCLQILQLKKPQTIIIIGKSLKKLNVAKKLGCDLIINTAGLSEKKSVERIKKDLAGYKVDVIIDATSNFAYKDSAIVEGINIIQKGGMVLLVGMHKPKKIVINTIVLNELKIIGTVSSPGTWTEAIRLLETNEIDVEALISDILSLKDVPSLFRRIETQPDEIIKPVIEID
ncbi:MAG: alcohol dehydrogenase catalytic domain-containing protein [Methanoregula sp.]|jgi:threonine dehydrogenase-like Zn-dependent dehydrogenase|uniref:zinc-dependent alcohol dehydrogenase n=1 Tax=Methanoregula sp. TaxID=2052170 RepID=UPI003C15054E